MEYFVALEIQQCSCGCVCFLLPHHASVWDALKCLASNIMLVGWGAGGLPITCHEFSRALILSRAWCKHSPNSLRSSECKSLASTPMCTASLSPVEQKNPYALLKSLMPLSPLYGLLKSLSDLGLWSGLGFLTGVVICILCLFLSLKTQRVDCKVLGGYTC